MANDTVTTIHGDMDPSLLEKREGVFENDHERTTFVEYWQLVHRSVHVTLKEGLSMDGHQGVVG